MSLSDLLSPLILQDQIVGLLIENARYKRAFEMSGILEHSKLGDMAPPLRLNVSDSKNIVKQIEGV